MLAIAALLIIIVEAVADVQSLNDNLLELNADVQEKNELTVKSKKEDLVDQDIMEYSAIHAEQNIDDNVFESGGAILDALAENDPKFKNVVKKSALSSKSKSKKTNKAAPVNTKKPALRKKGSASLKKKAEMIESADGSSEDKISLPYGIT